jgi:hypothetical protein
LPQTEEQNAAPNWKFMTKSSSIIFHPTKLANNMIHTHTALAAQARSLGMVQETGVGLWQPGD